MHVPALAVPQLGARLAALSDSPLLGEAGPLGCQPLPRGIEPAALVQSQSHRPWPYRRGRVLLWGYAFMLHLLAREMHAAAGMTAAEVADARAAHAHAESGL